MSNRLPTKIGRIVVAFAGMAFTTLLFSQAAAVSAQTLHCWTAVGSDGTVDEADLATVALSSNTAAVLNTVANATVDIRYNVVAVDGVFGGDATSLTVRFADNGPTARVIVNVRRTNIFSGVNTVLRTLDSDNYPPSAVAQTQTVSLPCGLAVDFETNIYYIEVQLIKTGAGGNPLIRAIQLCGNVIC